MAKRNSLTDYEVSLIKKLLTRGKHQNQEIAGLINRSRGNASSDVNSGRITNIKKNQIHKYVAVEPATDDEVKQFLNKFEIAAPLPDLGPIHPETLKALFPLKVPKVEKGGDGKLNLINILGPRKLHVSETDTVEGKESFDWGSRDKYGKTIAGFANNKGGYILFGVKDGSFEVVGIAENRMEKFDLRKANQYLTRTYNQAFRVEMGTFNVAGKTVGAFYIHPSAAKPAICKVDVAKLTSGAIYYRYPGETRTIQAPELEILLRERDKVAGGNLLNIAQKVQEMGVENTAILDVATGAVEGQKGSFYISEELLPALKFIREGQFEESEGAPTLKLMGELQPLTEDKVIVDREVKDNIRERDILEDFIKQEVVGNPKAYIEQLCHIQPVILPIYYYAHLAGFTLDALVEFLRNVNTPYADRVKKHIKRVTDGKLSSALPANTGLIDIMEAICGEETIQIADDKEAKKYLKAVRLIKPEDISLERILSVMEFIFTRFGANSKLRSAIRYAVADIDLKWFRRKLN